MNDVINNVFIVYLYIKTDRFHAAVRLLTCLVIDHRRRQNVVVTHPAMASCATFLFLPNFDVICDLLLNGSFAYSGTDPAPRGIPTLSSCLVSRHSRESKRQSYITKIDPRHLRADFSQGQKVSRKSPDLLQESGWLTLI